MNQFRRPFRINVGLFINQHIGYIRQFPFEFSEITLLNDFVLDNLTGLTTFDRTQQGLRLQGHFEASTRVICGRCLELFKLPLVTEFEELYTLPNHPLSENEQLIPEDCFIDLEPLINDYLALEIPINPICKISCKGLCNVCGRNLNIGVCDHQKKLNKPKKEKLNIRNQWQRSNFLV